MLTFLLRRDLSSEAMAVDISAFHLEFPKKEWKRPIAESKLISTKKTNKTEKDMEFSSILLPGIEDKRPFVIGHAAPKRRSKDETAIVWQIGYKGFLGRCWKPRTIPGGFEGVGSPALKWLQRVKRETGMYTAVEVATEKHVYEALKYGVDMLWIGARTTANPFAVQEIADTLRGTDIPVLIKNPVNPDLELWIGALERLYNVGITRLGAIHRGFSSSDKSIYRNMPQWHIPIELQRRFPNCCHLRSKPHGGRRDMIFKLSQQAMDLNFYGLIIESHCTPDEAWSDKDQQITQKRSRKF
jgi:chorismate mutase